MCHVCLSYVWLSLPKFILRCMNCLEFASPYCSLRGCLLHCDAGHVVITMLASLLLLSSLCVLVLVSFHVLMVYFVA